MHRSEGTYGRQRAYIANASVPGTRQGSTLHRGARRLSWLLLPVAAYATNGIEELLP